MNVHSEYHSTSEPTCDIKREQGSEGEQGLTGAVGVTLTTWGGIPETGTAPLGGRFLLVTNAQENGCKTKERNQILVFAT